MKCRECKKTVEKGSKFKDFCNEECKKVYIETYTQIIVKKEKKDKKPVIKVAPLSGEVLKAIYKSYGGIKWYKMAKKDCCNFYIRERDGTCITLAEPYHLFRLPCSECELGCSLASKYRYNMETKREKEEEEEIWKSEE